MNTHLTHTRYLYMAARARLVPCFAPLFTRRHSRDV